MPPIHNGSELSNTAVMSYITCPTSISIHDETLEGGKMHRYNEIHNFSIFFKWPNTKLVVFTLIFVQKASYSRAQCLLLTESL